MRPGSLPLPRQISSEDEEKADLFSEDDLSPSARSSSEFIRPEKPPRWFLLSRSSRNHRITLFIVIVFSALLALVLPFTGVLTSQPITNPDFYKSRQLKPFPAPPSGLIPLRTLPSQLLPTGSNKRRLIVIGDVHGCLAPLHTLLNLTDHDPAADHIVFTGDIVSGGEESAGVLDLVRKLGASSVRGDAEDRLLAAKEPFKLAAPKPPAGKNTHYGEQSPYALAHRLNERDIDMIRSFPVMLRLGRLPLGQSRDNQHVETVVVHGGLVPGLELEEQDLAMIMKMSSLGQDRPFPIKREEPKPAPAGVKMVRKQKDAYQWRWNVNMENKQGKPWYAVWDESQERSLPKIQSSAQDVRLISTNGQGQNTPSMRVLYGHDGENEPRRKKWSVGLGGSCVEGGRLNALIIEGEGKERVVSLDCSGLV